MLVLEPIFEADLQDEQYAYRKGRSAQDALDSRSTSGYGPGIRRSWMQT